MTTFQIPAMSCGHCVRSITEAVLAADPAAQVQADLASHSVQIDSLVPAATLAAALTAAGYAPTPAAAG
ncbi:hypothetical protein IP87_00020 [beta proteobacterium AAP121]|nr:hypothetical protein IP80_20275 [beta proteobacterium AAP65]KPG01188.1 hypothetical protein IP87_00020 [beta proteobacterium AAP121]